MITIQQFQLNNLFRTSTIVAVFLSYTVDSYGQVSGHNVVKGGGSSGEESQTSFVSEEYSESNRGVIDASATQKIASATGLLSLVVTPLAELARRQELKQVAFSQSTLDNYIKVIQQANDIDRTLQKIEEWGERSGSHFAASESDVLRLNRLLTNSPELMTFLKNEYDTSTPSSIMNPLEKNPTKDKHFAKIESLKARTGSFANKVLALRAQRNPVHPMDLQKFRGFVKEEMHSLSIMRPMRDLHANQIKHATEAVKMTKGEVKMFTAIRNGGGLLSAVSLLTLLKEASGKTENVTSY